jgi:hypothetical protein
MSMSASTWEGDMAQAVLSRNVAVAPEGRVVPTFDVIAQREVGTDWAPDENTPGSEAALLDEAPAEDGVFDSIGHWRRIGGEWQEVEPEAMAVVRSSPRQR